MKKNPIFLCSVIVLSVLFSGCGKKIDTKPLENYKSQMESVFENLETINNSINSINPDSEDSLKKLNEQFDKLDAELAYMASLTVPTAGAPETFSYIPGLANDATMYMSQANEYLKTSFTDTSYSENTLKAAMECYKRANKRIDYIIDLLHGKLPSDENITYQ